VSSVLSAIKLSKRYGRHTALNGVSFELREGEITALLGRNGAGKSTTLSLLTGRLEPDGGEVRILGQPLTYDATSLRGYFGFLPEGAPLFNDLTVDQHLTTMAGLRPLSREDQAATIADMLDRFELIDVRHKVIDTLSKGYRRRVALAAACLGQPKILILDEPTDGLDTFQKDRVLAQLRSAKSSQTLLISTHNLEDVAEICDRVIILNDGHLVFDGRVSELARRAPEGHLADAFKTLIISEGIES